MKLKYQIPAALAVVALSACAGTGEELPDSGSHLSAAHGAAQQGTVAPPPSTPSVQTADLLSNDDFNFATSWEMDIDFSLPLNNAYLSLCTEYVTSDTNTVDVKFDSCLVRTQISNGQFVSNNVPITNELKSIIAVLIDYANPSTPLYVEFNLSPRKDTLVWSEGTTI